MHQDRETRSSPSYLTCLWPGVPQPLVSCAPHLSPGSGSVTLDHAQITFPGPSDLQCPHGMATSLPLCKAPLNPQCNPSLTSYRRFSNLICRRGSKGPGRCRRTQTAQPLRTPGPRLQVPSPPLPTRAAGQAQHTRSVGTPSSPQSSGPEKQRSEKNEDSAQEALSGLPFADARAQ